MTPCCLARKGLGSSSAQTVYAPTSTSFTWTSTCVTNATRSHSSHARSVHTRHIARALCNPTTSSSTTNATSLYSLPYEIVYLLGWLSLWVLKTRKDFKKSLYRAVWFCKRNQSSIVNLMFSNWFLTWKQITFWLRALN